MVSLASTASGRIFSTLMNASRKPPSAAASTTTPFVVLISTICTSTSMIPACLPLLARIRRPSKLPRPSPPSVPPPHCKPRLHYQHHRLQCRGRAHQSHTLPLRQRPQLPARVPPCLPVTQHRACVTRPQQSLRGLHWGTAREEQYLPLLGSP